MKPNIAAGACSGAVGGFAGGIVKLLCERIAPPRPSGREVPPVVLLEKLLGRRLDEATKSKAAIALHFGFSISVAAAYGGLTEIWPSATRGYGTAFGEAIWAALHEGVLPALGATPELADLPVSEQVNEFVTHAIFGATVEAVRGALRPVLG